MDRFLPCAAIPQRIDRRFRKYYIHYSGDVLEQCSFFFCYETEVEFQQQHKKNMKPISGFFRNEKQTRYNIKQ